MVRRWTVTLLVVALVTLVGVASGLPPGGGGATSCSVSCTLGSCSAAGGNCDCHCGGFLKLFAYCSCDGMSVDDPPQG